MCANDMSSVERLPQPTQFPGSTAGLTQTGSFLARPFPATGGEFPLVRSTFLAPGAPLRAWVGLRVRF